MTFENFENHPLQLAFELQEKWPEMTLSFSKYLYRPQSPIDERRVFEVKATDVSAEWLQSQLASLEDDWELALNSLVRDSRGRMFHIPMIDFSKPFIGADDLVFMRSILGTSLCRSMVFFDSGRSMHGYSLQLLELKEWRVFLGRLLLLNLPGSEHLVDTRWIGHRLVSGYCALRWSSNSSHYLRMPTRATVTFPTVARETLSTLTPSSTRTTPADH